MFIGVQHKIREPQKFWDLAAEKLEKLPKGIECHAHAASPDGSHGFCLWECESVSKLQDYIEPIWGGRIATNEYFEVDAKNNSGLPIPVAR